MQPIRSFLGATLVAAALLGAGCYATVSGEAYGPDLVTVSPGVQVIADYDEPIFYTDGFYWRFYDGLWYRSSNYATGWYYWSSPPVTVLRIDRPYAYRHYRPTGYVARSRPRYRPSEVIVRDHRGPAPVYRAEPVIRERRGVVREAPPARAPSAAPVVRDHRQPPPPAKDSRVRDHRD